MKIVIDTNVVVSALFFGGKPLHPLLFLMRLFRNIMNLRKE